MYNEAVTEERAGQRIDGSKFNLSACMHVPCCG